MKRGLFATLRATIVSVALLVVAARGFALACTPSTSSPEVAVAGIYVDLETCFPDCPQAVWIYEESNGLEGLQRGDEHKDDTCGGQVESDTILNP